MLAMLPIIAALKRFGGFLMRLNPWQLALIALGLFALVQHFELAHARRQAVNYSRQLERCTSARHADQLAYTAAQTQAQAQNRADVARDESHKQELSNETVSRLNADLAELRRRLSEGGTAAPQSHLGSPGLPKSDQPASGTPGAAGMCLSTSELLRAAENEERHDRLIDYVEGLSKIDPNAH